MKRIILIFILLILNAILVGCNTEEKVKINFKKENVLKVIEINKGSSITNDTIPFEEENIELYYDAEKSKKYNGEVIINDITIYVYEKNGGYEFDEQQLKQDYLIYAISKGENYITIDDVKILDYYGKYDNSYIVRMDRGAYQVLTKIPFPELGIVFNLPNTNTPLVYREGKFYELYDAYYNDKIITEENLIDLHKKIK